MSDASYMLRLVSRARQFECDLTPVKFITDGFDGALSVHDELERRGRGTGVMVCAETVLAFSSAHARHSFVM